MEYEELLKKAVNELPKTKHTDTRFEPLQPNVMTGKQTIIRNFSEIAKGLRREQKHLAKFLFKELAVAGSMRGDELVLTGKINSSLVRQRVDEYIKMFVLCHECGKPDTGLTVSNKITTIKCEACGARKTVESL